MDGEFGWICFFAQRFTDAGSAAAARPDTITNIFQNLNPGEDTRAKRAGMRQATSASRRRYSQWDARDGSGRTARHKNLYHISDKNLNLGQDGYIS